MAELNERHMGPSGPTDVLAFPLEDEGLEQGRWPDNGTTGPDRPGPTARRHAAAARRRRRLPDRGRPPGARARRQPAPRRAPSTTRSPCSSSTASSTCSAWTTPNRTRPRRCRPGSASCSSDSTTDDEAPVDEPDRHRRAVVVLLGARRWCSRSARSCSSTSRSRGRPRWSTNATRRPDGPTPWCTCCTDARQRSAPCSSPASSPRSAWSGSSCRVGRDQGLDARRLAGDRRRAGRAARPPSRRSPRWSASSAPTRSPLRVTPVVGLIGRIPLLGMVGRDAVVVDPPSAAPGIDDVERPKVSEEELLALAEVAAEAEVIETSERALIESIIAFGDTIVREVMVPRPDMVTVESAWVHQRRHGGRDPQRVQPHPGGAARASTTSSASPTPRT